jgi:hypothetical protein
VKDAKKKERDATEKCGSRELRERDGQIRKRNARSVS